MRKELDHHVGVGIIKSEKTQELLLGVYDDTYPDTNWRGRAKLIGGNHEKDDISPRHIFYREVNEEFSHIKDKESEFATEEDIKLIRETILLNALPYRDFLVKMPQRIGKQEHQVIYSVFNSFLTDKILTLIRKNIELEKRIINEGLLRIVSVDELAKGNLLVAAATGLILGEYFNARIPNPDNATAENIGLPRNSFNDYAKEFSYKKPVKITI